MSIATDSRPRMFTVWPLLYVSDLERSMEHYTKALGFEVEQEAPSSEGVYWCQVTRGGASLMLQQHDRSEGLIYPVTEKGRSGE